VSPKRRRKLTRSETMARVRGKDTKPELQLRRALWAAGLRYRLGLKLPGSPDLAFPRARLAIFVDGCFWHGCPLHSSAPATRWDYWSAKLASNVARDARCDAALRGLGWTPLRIWTHELRWLEEVVGRVAARIRPAAEWPPMAAEPSAVYEVAAPWYRCDCGSDDVRVLEVDGPGSLNPRGRKRPGRARLRCWGCGEEYEREVG